MVTKLDKCILIHNMIEELELRPMTEFELYFYDELQKLRQTHLKALSTKDYFLFAYNTGYIEMLYKPSLNNY